MSRALILLALLLAALGLLTALGCGPAVESPTGASRAGSDSALAAPAYHSPGAWWRAEHSAQLGGAGSLWPWSRPAHNLGECLVCHRPAQSCQPCHAYVGAPAIGEQG